MRADASFRPTGRVSLTVNGVRHQVEVDHRTSLLDLLRERLHLTGTKNRSAGPKAAAAAELRAMAGTRWLAAEAP